MKTMFEDDHEVFKNLGPRNIIWSQIETIFNKKLVMSHFITESTSRRSRNLSLRPLPDRYLSMIRNIVRYGPYECPTRPDSCAFTLYWFKSRWNLFEKMKRFFSSVKHGRGLARDLKALSNASRKTFSKKLFWKEKIEIDNDSESYRNLSPKFWPSFSLASDQTLKICRQG